jgi:hypothetical protein
MRMPAQDRSQGPGPGLPDRIQGRGEADRAAVATTWIHPHLYICTGTSTRALDQRRCKSRDVLPVFRRQ